MQRLAFLPLLVESGLEEVRSLFESALMDQKSLGWIFADYDCDEGSGEMSEATGRCQLGCSYLRVSGRTCRCRLRGGSPVGSVALRFVSCDDCQTDAGDVHLRLENSALLRRMDV